MRWCSPGQQHKATRLLHLKLRQSQVPVAAISASTSSVWKRLKQIRVVGFVDKRSSCRHSFTATAAVVVGRGCTSLPVLWKVTADTTNIPVWIAGGWWASFAWVYSFWQLCSSTTFTERGRPINSSAYDKVENNGRLSGVEYYAIHFSLKLKHLIAIYQPKSK